MKKLALIAPVIAVALAGCAHDPTIAGKVAGQTISMNEVSTLANFMCADASAQAKQSGAPQASTPMAAVNQRAMTLIAGARAVVALRRAHNLPVPPITATNAGPVLALLPAAERPRAQRLVDEVSSVFSFVATRINASQPDQVIEVFVGAINDEAAKGQFSNNPAYPVLTARAETASASLSQAVSDSAKASMAMTPSSAYLSGLPASQKCG